ncbi:uncharacterized protein LOC122502542, partial [Leptopilina heterotoma]|uniref:uncharacterized protein LOC122502542 n=1 Tax=Leptopilina heterotoma TaxID=63436 RepID=UPI001CA910C6
MGTHVKIICFRHPEWKKPAPYKKVKKSIRRWLRKNFPPMPRHIVDIEEVLNCSEWRKRLQYCVEEGITNEITVTSVTDETDFCHVIFHSEKFLNSVLEIDVATATADATFRTVPWLKGSLQILIFSVISYGKITPIFFVLMSAKSFVAYNSVAKKIRELSPRLKMEKLITDFEIALKKAFCYNFPEIKKLIGCFFHLCYNLDKYINKENLRKYLLEYECLHAFVEKVKHLALLPAEDITETFNYLVERLDTLDDIKLLDGSEEFEQPRIVMDPFISYFRRYWLRITTPTNFSVYLETRRTNNDTERNNRAWNKVVGNHPNFVDFIGKLIVFMQITHHDYNDTKRNCYSERKLSEEETHREQIIKTNWLTIRDAVFATPLERQQIILQFLENCRRIVYKHGVELHKSLLTGEDEPPANTIKDTCTVIRSTPWEELEDADNWRCPFCTVLLENETSYFSHVDLMHSLHKCDNCGEFYHPEKQHDLC